MCEMQPCGLQQMKMLHCRLILELHSSRLSPTNSPTLLQKTEEFIVCIVPPSPTKREDDPAQNQRGTNISIKLLRVVRGTSVIS